ncbi:ABC transporter substrate-binding protein [Psychromarinibacter sp. C21-152]|uniref:ABC transporter substrate-binding protein n=1 Tax=Psychromarinibacter sediminicola TaxID=3033385 RepID=A0AAE3T7G1_9RHOB|nr:ABC transporter substrate-binding protein [Psychromarinibacter sediminicola]MDF0599633.1 ABC transporter substrate-binding protein [Psychromarinibacter sediminicola]
MTDSVFRGSRRKFLQVSAAAAASAASGATLGFVGPAAAQGMKYSEAPELAELVAAGQLPPVEERLPAEPVVVEPMNEIGEYGGTIRTGIIQNRGFQARSSWGPEPILRIARDSSTIIPNLAESWEYTNGGKTFVLHIRPIRFSDGAPLNAACFDFWWNHVNLKTALTPSPLSQFVVAGEVPEFEVVDDYTVQWTWSKPHANLPGLLAHWVGAQIPRWLPRHYLEQYHEDFAAADALAAKVDEEGFSTWDELFNNHSAAQYMMPFQHPEQPTLLPFRLRDPMELNTLVAERNPWYWKVDPEGQQLPYIGEIVVTNFESGDVRDAAIAAGQMNWVNTDTTFTNLPLYRENAERGNYEARLWLTSRGAEHTIMLNHEVKDPVLKALFNDIRFKRAVSHAIDRQLIADVVYLGFGVPSQVQMIPGSAWRNEDWVKKDTAYDPDTANALLDEVGLSERDGNGIRLRPDGAPLVMNMDFPVDDPGSTQVGELLIELMREVGITFNIRPIAREQVRTLLDNNDMEVGIWIADKCSDTMFPHSPEWHVPMNASGGWNAWGAAYAWWRETDGEKGIEPTGDVAKVIALFEEMQVTVDEDRRHEIGTEILRLNAENLWNIGDVGEVPIPVILGTNFRNYPEQGFTSYDWLGNYQYQIEQTYFEGGEWVGEQG